MQISNNYVQSGTAEWVKKASAGESSAQAKKENAAKASSDKVSISTEAGKNNSAEALVRARANALPETREEKIAVARERIDSGYYNTHEFGKELANRLVEG